MSKAILIMDMPINCSRCILKFERVVGCTRKSCVSCRAFPTRVIKNQKVRQEYCPLREVPQKKNLEEMKKRTLLMDYPYAQGYNQCIDEILGGAE